MKKALLVIDMLEDFVDAAGSLRVPDTERILPRMIQELEGARARGDPIVYVCDSHAPDDPEFQRMGWPVHAVEGTRGAQIARALQPRAGDSIVKKKTYSGFYGTDLERVLGDLGVKTLRLTGCVTNICVFYTAADAAMRGYDVEVVEDAVAGLNPEDHAFALRQMRDVLGLRIVGRQP